MLTVEQAAQKAGVAVYKLREWIAEGKLDTSQIDVHHFIHEDDLQEVIRQDKKESAQRMFNKWVENGKNEEG